MLERFRQFWTGVWAPVGDLLLAIGVTANQVTVVGTVGVVSGALVCFPQGWLFWGVIWITAFVFSDMIDGYMSRKVGSPSKFGAFLDSTMDRIGDGAIFGGIALYYASSHATVDLGDVDVYLWLSLVCLVMGSVTSYARSRAESLGYDAKVGIAERSDRLVSILVMTGISGLLDLPFLMEITLWALAAASTVTVIQRIWVVRQQALAETERDRD